VAAAFLPAKRRRLVAAAFLPAARRLRVVAAFLPAALRLRVATAFQAATRRFLVAAAFFPALAMLHLAVERIRNARPSSAAAIANPIRYLRRQRLPSGDRDSAGAGTMNQRAAFAELCRAVITALTVTNAQTQRKMIPKRNPVGPSRRTGSPCLAAQRPAHRLRAIVLIRAQAYVPQRAPGSSGELRVALHPVRRLHALVKRHGH
jgi:hypothetical protein